MNVHMELVKDAHADDLLRSVNNDSAYLTEPGWLVELRADASACANRLALPTTQDEEWRFTDLSPLLKVSFQPANVTPELELANIEHFIVPEAATSRLVFVNGIYAPQLSACASLPSGTVVNSLAEAMSSYDDVVRTHIGQLADFQQDIFSALNTSLLHDGALVIIPKGQVVSAPIHLLFVSTHQENPTAVYPRCLIVAEKDSSFTLIEDYVSLDGDVYFTNAVTEIIVGENAEVRHAKLQRESRTAFHIAQCAVTLARDSVYTSTTVTFGARLSRHNLHVLQNAEGAQCTLDGLALISARQLADTHTFMDHAHAHGKSTQLHKCIVDGAAHAVFSGKVFVRKGAQLTNSAQSNRNLLLSDKARVDTKPQLEIFADDVKCAHGATVGQLDEEELFYLKSRGLNELAARNLLTYAFAAELIDRIPIASVVEQLRQIVLTQTQIELREKA
ncbi:MAG: Fe-S cluster assembly protein SufD [Gammaproteobacteria bacterium]